MQISANTVVTIDYKVSDTDNNLVDPGQEPIVFLHGTGGIFPKIEAALLGKSVGDALEIALEPADAFGDYNDDGAVDAADYVAWRKSPSNFGEDPGGYNTWRAHFDQTFGNGAAMSSDLNSIVPEPGCLVLARRLLREGAVLPA